MLLPKNAFFSTQKKPLFNYVNSGFFPLNQAFCFHFGYVIIF
ncbi:hypothetical protein D920_00329 [Enterococcus faecalis 13-SD-W-01]|nr:hypothetical protein D920_00329 [Enterococcus faecalis 13-SD-W-01]